jgi:GNAT superfamily N-acetyltransferase
MDPLFKAYGTERYAARDYAVRMAEELDIPAFADLFRAHYGDSYPCPDVYDGSWIKRSIYSDTTICLVLEDEGEVLATGSVLLNYGDRNDRSAELARLAVAPDRARSGLGRRVIDALFKVAENSVEFVIGESRTAHRITQEMLDNADFNPIGFLPQYLYFADRRESLMAYGKLHGDGALLRCPHPPRIIPEVEGLAGFVLRRMGLSIDLEISQEPGPPVGSPVHELRPLDRSAMGHLLRIPTGRTVDPLLFGNISIDQGFTHIRDQAQYVVACNDQQQPIGTIGYRIDESNRISHAIELIAASRDAWPALCGAFIQNSLERGAEGLSADVSAYQPGLQRILFDIGFRPAAYAPAMVFHGMERLDVVKMIKLNVPYDPGPMALTDLAGQAVALVEQHFQ